MNCFSLQLYYIISFSHVNCISGKLLSSNKLLNWIGRTRIFVTEKWVSLRSIRNIWTKVFTVYSRLLILIWYTDFHDIFMIGLTWNTKHHGTFGGKYWFTWPDCFIFLKLGKVEVCALGMLLVANYLRAKSIIMDIMSWMDIKLIALMLMRSV